MQSTDETESRDLPSCAGCRARKLKCSREQPTCTNCARFELPCIYDLQKNKPGLKRGTVDKLTKRIDSLERQILERENTSPNQQKVAGSRNSSDETPAITALSLETQRLSSSITSLTQTLAFLAESSGRRVTSPTERESRSAKRQKIDDPPEMIHTLATDLSTAVLNSEEDVNDLLETYFSNLHPWVPMIHKSALQNNVQGDDGKHENKLVLQAMLIGASRYNDQRKSPPDLTAERLQQACNHTLLMANQSLEIKNLQALIILAFKYLGDGELAKAWPIVACLTRMAQFLGICVETTDCEACPESFFSPPLQPAPSTWAEEEERRRVFWNIFILDRLSSITAGWKTALTADNSNRQLPVCGTFWNESNPRTTPYFGIWNKSATKMANSVAFLPAHYPSPQQRSEPSNNGKTASPRDANQSNSYSATDTTDNTGAFAYFVESLESLCQINEYFLRKNINFDDRQEVFSWLTRFKELDFRLVQWKIFLPPKWKDPNIPPPETANILDPNMSLAHVTHNTSLIMLHQKIGYPEANLKNIPLPNFYSADTCQSAAVGTSDITRNYLRHSSTCKPLSPHWAFCVFVSAKILLVHHRFYSQELNPHFWSLVKCLQEMGERWNGNSVAEPRSSLAHRLLENLQQLHAKPSSTTKFISRVDEGSPHSAQRNIDYEAQDASPQNDLFFRGVGQPAQSAIPFGEPTVLQSGPVLVDHLAERPVAHLASPSQVPNCRMSTASGNTDELSGILRSFSDGQFVEMDRVISFDDLSYEGLFDVSSLTLAQEATQSARSIDSGQWPGPNTQG